MGFYGGVLTECGTLVQKEGNRPRSKGLRQSYVEVVKGSECRDATRVRVEVKGEEISKNVSRLEHCLVGK